MKSYFVLIFGILPVAMDYSLLLRRLLLLRELNNLEGYTIYNIQYYNILDFLLKVLKVCPQIIILLISFTKLGKNLFTLLLWWFNRFDL